VESQLARVSSNRRIGVGESVKRVVRNCEWRNRDRRSLDKRGKRVSVDLYQVSGFRGAYTRPLDSRNREVQSFDL
jgi:hypothetical protein